MKYSDIYVGLKVQANCKEEHERHPRYYPREGTKGVIVTADNGFVMVQWEKDTTASDGIWAVYYKFIEPAKGYWWRKWKKIFAKLKK